MCQQFWQVMQRFTDEERCLYLKFVWGRARLPVDCRNLSYRHGIEYCSGRNRDSLPIAHTCFFRCDFPDYSSVEIFYERLLYAVKFCGDIDADRGANDIGAEE